MTRVLVALAAVALVVGIALCFVTQPFAGRAQAWGGPHAEAARLEETVRALVALGPRNDEAGEARAAKFVQDRLKALGYVPIVQHYKLTPEELKDTHRSNEPDLNGEFTNVFAYAGASPPPLLVIGAHYDARRAYPGADDDGSGVAALLELARMFKQHPPRQAVQLAFYSNEERGLVGSARAPKDGVSAMISLEMLGCFGEPQKFPAPGMSLLYPEVQNGIVVVGRLRDFALARKVKAALRGSNAQAASIDAPEAIPGIGNSDHRSYWEAGIHAVMVTDTAWYRNPRYHTARDTPDTLDYRKMALITDGIAALATAN
jgi:hypothetical protein